MTDAHLNIKDLIIDCADPERLASFWSSLLGRPVAGRTGPYAWLTRENGLGMGFQRVAEPKAGKNRVHFDLASPGPAAQQRRVESLPSGPFELDDEGRTSYLDDPQGS
jgi:hypothetical protein